MTIRDRQRNRQCNPYTVGEELVEGGGYEQSLPRSIGVLLKRHAQYQRGELTFRAVAAKLGLSVRDLYDLLEQKGLPT